MWKFETLDINEITTAFWTRLESDPEAKSFATTYDKGAKRHDGFENPSGTINVLAAPIHAETRTATVTVIINVYVDDTQEGRADFAKLGKAGNFVQRLFHRADLPMHPEGQIVTDNLNFKDMIAEETLFLRSEIKGEHVASTRITCLVRRKK